MNNIITLNESELKNIITECVKRCLNEGMDFGKFGGDGDMALKIVRQKLSGAIKDGIIDPRALMVNEFGHVIYTKKLPAGVKINPRTFEVTQVSKRSGGRKNKNEMPLKQYQQENPNAEFVPLVFGSPYNIKVTDSVRKYISNRYRITRDGAVLDTERNMVVVPYLNKTYGCINFRMRDENGNEIFHGNTTIDALVKATFGK